MTSTWDIGGRRTRIAHPDGFYVDQDYLVTGEVTKIRENGAASGVGVLATFAYDQLGRRASLTRGDCSVLGYGYDNVSRLSQLSDNLAGTAYDQTLGFSYNPASQINSNTRSNDAYAWTGHYNLNRGYTANGLNQYTASGPITPTYDTKGNLTSAGTATYTYSSENLLTSASGGIALAYDPAKRLYQTSGGTPGTTRFAYDGANLIAEYNGSNAMLRRYVHGPSVDEPLVWYEGSGTTDRRFLHSDERGSVVAITNGAGTTLNVNGYNEYGIPSLGNAGRFQYTGQTWLPELGMYYYKARIYSPTLGRFMQTDPIGYGGGMNLHAYVGGDPVNRIDPNGLTAMCNSPWGGRAPVPCPNTKKSLTGASSGNSGSSSSGRGSDPGGTSTGQVFNSDDIVITGIREDDIVITGARDNDFGFLRNGVPPVLLAGMGHNEPPSLLRGILGRIGGAIGLILNLGGDTCKSCSFTPDSIMNDPNVLTGRTLSEVEKYLVASDQWRITEGVRGTHKQQVWVYREWGGRDWTGRQIRWHPGGGHHGPDSYWLVNNGRGNVRLPSGGR